MTDQDSAEPDGFVIVHRPQGGGWYGIGPFPPIDDLVDAMMKESDPAPCGCRIEVLWVRLPKGVVLAIEPPPEIALAARRIVEAMLDPDEPVQ